MPLFPVSLNLWGNQQSQHPDKHRLLMLFLQMKALSGDPLIPATGIRFKCEMRIHYPGCK